MKLTKKEKKALKELKEGLKKIYGDNLSRLILYGSKARGDATEDSDIDVMVVLKNMKQKEENLGEVVADICLKYDLYMEVIPVEEKYFLGKEKPLFLENVEKEGILL